MWPDNETDQDFLNFAGVAGTVAEIVVQARGRPISIGVSGAWGVGKSSMIRLIRKSLLDRGEAEKPGFVFVDFNAWLYQGFDDARAALMEVIATALEREAEKRKTGVERTKELWRRINWVRAARVAGAVVAAAAGVPPLALAAEAVEFAKGLGTGDTSKDAVEGVEAAAKKIGGAAHGGLLNAKPVSSPPQEIQALRQAFEDTLQELGVTLVVLIDDLDRCLPETTISTLEAMRLFLFLKNAAFVIAADTDMIKHAVRRHFDGVDDDLVTNYFDKLIQVPIRVPPLGTQEVRAYMMLLFIENSGIGADDQETIRARVCEQLGQTWQGKRVDRSFIESLGVKLPADVNARLEAADRLAPIMTTASRISGNPRLIKRFLNALAIRMTISRAHGVGVDEAVLAKMLLFERCGSAKAYGELASAVAAAPQGRPAFLAEWEETAHAGKELKLDGAWEEPFIKEWLALPPRLADKDLRGVLYVSREHAPIMTPEDRLSSEGATLLAALLAHPDMASELVDRLKVLPRAETAVIMDRLLDAARQEQEWGAPPILEACLVVSAAEPTQGARLATFLAERPPTQIKANIVPKIAGNAWTETVWVTWEKNPAVIKPVKDAIKARRQDGNVIIK
jgi:predicted KAP-like P-loop ATPase